MNTTQSFQCADYSVKSMQLLGVKYTKGDSIESLQGVKYTQCEYYAMIIRCEIHTVWIACNHNKVLNTHSVNSMQSFQGAKYSVNSMQSLQDVKYT